MEGVPLRDIVVEGFKKVDERFDALDARLRHIESAGFATWRRLGAALGTIIALTLSLLAIIY